MLYYFWCHNRMWPILYPKKNIGKKKAWIDWDLLWDILTQVFITLTHNPPITLLIDSDLMIVLQRFIIVRYDPKCEIDSVNQTRKFKFTTNLKSLESIPTTKHKLFQHVKRYVIAVNYWSQSLLKEPDMLHPTDYGWVWNACFGIWMPYWSDLPVVISRCALIISCGCKVVCKSNCKCSRNGMRCTYLCSCQGMCINNEQYDNWTSDCNQFECIYLKGFGK